MTWWRYKKQSSSLKGKTHGILVEGGEPAANAVEEVVEVALVLVVIEEATRVLESVGLVIALGLQDKAGFEEDLANVGIDGAEPSSEVIISTSIVNESVGSIKDEVERGAVGKAF